MPAEISPEEMAAMQEQAGKKTDQPVTKLVQEVGQGLSKLSDMLSGSQGATDEDRQQMQQIMDLYIDLVEKKLGSAGPGENPESEEPEMGQVPMQQGQKGVPMGPQSRA